MTSTQSQLITGEQALAAFREGLTGPYAFELLQQAGGRLLVRLPVGVGKSAWLVRILTHALDHDLAGLVVVLVPRRDILQELLGRLPDFTPPAVLLPRPRKNCGDLDAPWSEYEQNGLGLLGREHFCSPCPRAASCPWPGQFAALHGQRLILATQRHLDLNPFFLDQLRRAAGAADSRPSRPRASAFSSS